MNFYTDIDRDPEFRKKYGAHFTPEPIAAEICSTVLTMLGPVGDISDFKVLDLASGTGVFSFHFATQFSKLVGISFKEAIERHCVMVEIDDIFISKCRDNFKRLGCVPNIYKGDALFNNELDKMNFNAAISNPPYIRIQNLATEYREKLQRSYISCRFGAADIYLAFIERGLSLLKPGGSLGFITPASYLRSESGKVLRKILADKLTYIKDFGSDKQFNCGAYTAITYAKNDKLLPDKFVYNLNSDTYRIDRANFIDKLLIGNFDSETTLKDFCKIRGGIATLRDKVFIFDPDEIYEDYFIYKGFKIETSATKKFVKLSLAKTEKDIYNSKLFCIYPYKDTDDGYARYSEAEFKTKFPGAYAYLESNKDTLLERDRGKNKGYTWFEFGRTQGLAGIGKCIVTSTMNKKPNFFAANLGGYLFSSGLALYDIDTPYNDLLIKLNSNDMKEYIKNNGSKYSGGWRGYNKKILERFPIDK